MNLNVIPKYTLFLSFPSVWPVPWSTTADDSASNGIPSEKRACEGVSMAFAVWNRSLPPPSVTETIGTAPKNHLQGLEDPGEGVGVDETRHRAVAKTIVIGSTEVSD